MRARGVLLLGPPGSGKSQFAKALGAETNRPTLVLDVGALLGSLVGQSEAEPAARQRGRSTRWRPCVVMVDEVEKALAGSSGPSGDSGVASRIFAGLLTWLNDHESDAFVVCTSNDVSRLPPEFARSERFDATFFLDLPAAPGRRPRADLADVPRQVRRSTRRSRGRRSDRDWTGAEIKSWPAGWRRLLGLPLAEAPPRTSCRWR